jgi:hypothetical protein
MIVGNFKCSRLEFVNVVACFLFVVFLIFSLFHGLSWHIFQFADDYIYPNDATNFLLHGEFGWAGAKPGIIVLASLLHLHTPLLIMYMYALFGLLTVIGLYFLIFYLVHNRFVAASAAVLWASSPFLFYFSKTHIVVYVAFYICGLACTYRGFSAQKWILYYLGFFLLGFGVLTYYVLLFYMPFVFLYFLWLFVRSKKSFIEYVLRTSIPFLLPIFIHDGACTLGYLIAGKRNWPFLYSLWSQFQVIGGYDQVVSFFHYIKIFFQLESCVISVSILCSLVALVICYRAHKHVFEFFFLLLMCPFLFLLFRGMAGKFIAFRAFAAGMPLLYGLVAGVLSFAPLKDYWKYLCCIIVAFGFIRLFSLELHSRDGMKSYYAQLVEFVESSPYALVVHVGPRHRWEQLFTRKEHRYLLPIFMYPHEFNNPPHPHAVLDEMRVALNNKRRIVVLRTRAVSTHWAAVEEMLKDHFVLKLIQQVYNPHEWTVLSGEFLKADDIEALQKVDPPYIYVYEVLEKKQDVIDA